MNLDKITLFYHRGVDILFIKHPTRTSLGVIFGFILDGLINLFFPVLDKSSIIAITHIRLWHSIAAGICLLHSPSFFRFIFRKPIGPESIDEIIEIINATNLTEIEKREKFEKVIDKVIEKALENEQFKQRFQAQQEQTRQNPPPSLD